MSEETVFGTPVIEVPNTAEVPISERDAFAMPIEELKRAAGIDGAAPIQAQPIQSAVPDVYSLEQLSDGVQLSLSAEYGGEIFKGKDINEVVAKLAKSKADGNAYIKQLKAGPNNAPPQFQPQATVEPSPEDEAQARQLLQSFLLTPEVKQQIFAQGLESDPRASEIYDAYRTWHVDNTMFEFHRRNPGYLDTPENAKALHEAMGELPEGRPLTVDDLETGLARAVVLRKSITLQDPQAKPAAAPRPPVMPTSSGSDYGNNHNVWSMPLDQLAKLAGIHGNH